MSRIPKTIRIIGEKSFSWQHITKASERELQYLEDHFGFEALDLHDCLPPLQRPKLIVRDSYVFLILNIPCFNKNDQRLYPVEIDIFLTKHGIVTVSNETIPSLENFFELLESDAPYQRGLMASPGVFFEQLIDELLDDMFPKLLKISNDIERLNGALLAQYSYQTLEEIMRLKNILIVFQKAMQPCRDLFSRIEPLVPQYLCQKTKQCPTFHRLLSHTTEIWDSLAMYDKAVDAMQAIHMNAVSVRTNDIIKTLTMFSIWLAVLGAIGGFFGMGLTGTPFMKNTNAFWMVMGLSSFATACVLLVFKRKKWL